MLFWAIFSCRLHEFTDLLSFKCTNLTRTVDLQLRIWLKTLGRVKNKLFLYEITTTTKKENSWLNHPSKNWIKLFLYFSFIRSLSFSENYCFSLMLQDIDFEESFICFENAESFQMRWEYLRMSFSSSRPRGWRMLTTLSDRESERIAVSFIIFLTRKCLRKLTKHRNNFLLIPERLKVNDWKEKESSMLALATT